jgi:ubiquinone/menaquinone biosynthesis C-methylase UbiE
MFGVTNLFIGKKNEERREKWIKNILKEIPAGKKILDAGAGESQYKKFCSHLKYVSQDFNQYNGKGDESGLQTGDFDYSGIDIVSDIINIPVEDNTYDAVMCTEVLEHLPDPVKAIKEFSRILKKDGHLVLTAPFCSLTHYSPYHFSTGFNKYYYETHLNNYGFTILEMERNGNYFEYMAQELQRLGSVAKKYSHINFFKKVLLKFATVPLLLLLQNFKNNDTSSEELLCFGYHVFARKE